ncbi:MAG: GNAT family N-acetyltransferase [Clostridiales bacterium]|nr:GNAT family N-acetyltransferase [Clostridiales bacterium]
MKLNYEAANPDDAEAIFVMCKALIDRYEDLASIDYSQVLAWVSRKIAGCIGEYERIMLEGELVGYVHFSQDGDRMELDDLYILPEYQGRSIGTRVIQRCCGMTDLPVYLYVFIRNEGAVKLYQRLGFRIIQTIGNSRYIMQKG